VHDGLPAIEARLRACEEALVTLANRVRSLEGQTERMVEPARDETAASEPLIASIDLARSHAAASIDSVSILSLAGRTCVVLGGAFLLRALTDSGRLASASGVGLGFVYAAAWIGAADHSGRRRPISGLFHGLAGVLIGLPLLWEASLRFHLLAPQAAALALASLSGLALAVAWHRDLQVLAVFVTCGAVITALALAFATGALVPYLLVLVLLATAAWWISDVRDWAFLKWPAILPASVMVAIVAGRVSVIPPLESPAAAVAIVVLYLVSVVAMAGVRLIGWRRPVRPFEVMHTIMAVAAAFVACVIIAPRVSDRAPAIVFASGIALGVAAYAVAVVARDRGRVAPSAFQYFSTLGLVFVVMGCALALSGVVRDFAFTALAILGVGLAMRAHDPTMAAHGAVYVVAAAVSAGLFACALRVWLLPVVAWPAFPLAGWLVLGASSAGGFIPRTALSRGLELALSMARLAIAIVLVVNLATLLVLLMGPLVAGTPPDPGRLAVLKTVMLSAIAVALAMLRRLPFGREFGWLAYLTLLVCAAKLLIEDFRVSSPATLFIALAVFGTALILTARHSARS